MRIRRATAEDCPAMLELIKELALFEKAPDEVTVDPQHFLESGFGESPVWWAFVAEEEVEGGLERFREVERGEKVDGTQLGEIIQSDRIDEIHSENLLDSTSLNLSKPLSTCIVAFALYYIRYSTWKGQVMYLEDIIVTEKMRGKGIGTMLMDRLIEEAREKGFKRISWQVLDWNEPAIKFYKKYGASFDPEWLNASLEL